MTNFASNDFLLHKTPTSECRLVTCGPGLARSVRGRACAQPLLCERRSRERRGLCGSGKTRQEGFAVRPRAFLWELQRARGWPQKWGWWFHCAVSAASLAAAAETLWAHAFSTRVRGLSAPGQRRRLGEGKDRWFSHSLKISTGTATFTFRS